MTAKTVHIVKPNAKHIACIYAHRILTMWQHHDYLPQFSEHLKQLFSSGLQVTKVGWGHEHLCLYQCVLQPRSQLILILHSEQIVQRSRVFSEPLKTNREGCFGRSSLHRGLQLHLSCLAMWSKSLSRAVQYRFAGNNKRIAIDWELIYCNHLVLQ